MSSFPYGLFKRGWGRRSDSVELEDAMHLPLPISHSAEVMHSRRSTRDSMGRQRLKRLLDTRRGIIRFGLPAGGWYLYWSDIFHTLLNMPRHRFLLVFFSVYLTEYLVFALLYLTQPDSCVGGDMRFTHALWFSVQTATTLGYTSQLQPQQDCTSVYVIVILQVITASLVDYCMMGLVFARFASPNKRSFTIRFSSTAVLFQRPEDGLWCLSFRLANIRKHALISPQVCLMLALPSEARGTLPRISEAGPADGGDGSGHGTGGAGGIGAAGASGGGGGVSGGVAHFRFRELAIEDLPTQYANLRLGLHAHINHIIRPGSPLYDLSLDCLESLGAEVLCFMEGVDPTTSNNFHARHSYTPADIRMNERFVPIELKLRRGELGLDFSGFDATTAKALAAGGADEVREGGIATFLMPVPGPSLGPSSPGAAPAPTAPAGGDVEAGWAATGAGGAGPSQDPLGAARGGGGGGGLAHEMDTVMAAALSGDMRSHMRALRSQSIRSLTTPLLALPQLVPSVSTAAVGGGGGTPFGAATATAAIGGGGEHHPLAFSSHSGAAGNGAPVHAHVYGHRAGPGLSGVPAGGGAGGSAAVGLGPGAVLDLLDAVLTDSGATAAVKRQAAELKEAVAAAERVPRGPAELAGRQL